MTNHDHVLDNLGPVGQYWQSHARCAECGADGVQVMTRLVRGRLGTGYRVFWGYCPVCGTEHGDHRSISGALREMGPGGSSR